MHAQRGTNLSVVRLVGNAVTPAFQRAVAWLLDGISAAVTYRHGSDAVVHTITGLEPSGTDRVPVAPRSGGRGRGNRVFHTLAFGIDEPRYFPNWEGSPVVFSPRGATEKRSKNTSGDRHTGRRGLRRKSAKSTPKRKAVHVVARCMWCGSVADVSANDLCFICDRNFSYIKGKAPRLAGRGIKQPGSGKPQ
jgi:hypothetical protein